MEGGILNEPVREAAQRLLDSFGEQMGLSFEHLLFIAVAGDGTFRSAHYTMGLGLNAESIRLIARHLNEWADTVEE